MSKSIKNRYTRDRISEDGLRAPPRRVQEAKEMKNHQWIDDAWEYDDLDEDYEEYDDE